MCGIAGFVDPAAGPDEARARLTRMLDLIAHRGPDGAGTAVERGLALGMRRLSIIDLAGGNQPIWNEDETIGVVFNGEIYNYRELRAQLESRGHVFRTHSDTEVLVHLYEDHGRDLLPRLRGMFGFAILDRPRRQLLLARDHFGQKPLYYFHGGGRFAFGSELKCLLTLPFVSRELDPEALPDFATWLSLPPPRTHFREIRKLPAGSSLVVPLSGEPPAAPARYWRFEIDAAPDITDLDAGADLVHQTFEESVRLHFVADVPVGVLLSSGLDSRTIATYARRLHPEGISTFSIGDASGNSECAGARQTAEELGTRHHECTFTGADLGRDIDRVAWHLDEPVGDPAAFAVWKVCRAAREHVKVLLSGEGADELFAGYAIKYRAHLHTLQRSAVMRRLAGWLPPLGPRWPGSRFDRLRDRAHLDPRTEIVALRTQGLPGDSTHPRGLSTAQLLRLRERQVALGRAMVRPQRHPLSTLLAFDVDWMLAESLLQKADKMSMAASIELRAPFIDVPMANAAARLGAHLKLGPTTGKVVLREMLARQIAEPFDRPKRGFHLPLNAWMQQDLREQVEAQLFASDAAIFAALDRALVRRAWDEFQAGAWNGALTFYSLWLYEAWHRTVVRANAVAP